MARLKLIALTNPVDDEADKEFNRWYDEQHVPDVLSVPGFFAAQRFRLASEPGDGPVYRYLAIYELETDNAQQAVERLSSLANTVAMPITGALDRVNVFAGVFEPITDLVSNR